MGKPNIILFCSGNGSNAKAIIAYAQQQQTFTVSAIFCNNKNAGIIPWANANSIDLVLFTRVEFSEENFINKVKQYRPELIVLAGFLLQVPTYLINAYTNKIVNIHPALLPKYGGKGMYGHYVHEAVKANKETESGITIHLVNEHYDEGEILKQVTVTLTEADSPETIAQKVLKLEHEWYAKVIAQQVLKR